MKQYSVKYKYLLLKANVLIAETKDTSLSLSLLYFKDFSVTYIPYVFNTEYSKTTYYIHVIYICWYICLYVYVYMYMYKYICIRVHVCIHYMYGSACTNMCM